MGAHIDVATLLEAAERFGGAAERLRAATHAGPTFGAATAGRTHARHGDAVRAGVDRLIDDVRAWARADDEIASVLRASADRYVGADDRATARLG